jgi:hypothetical protein
MKKAADVFSKMIFWAENFFYIIFFLLYEFILCPYIFFKVMINIFILSKFLWLPIMFFFWLLLGPFLLLLAICKDMFYFIKILCDYQDEED